MEIEKLELNLEASKQAEALMKKEINQRVEAQVILLGHLLVE